MHREAFGKASSVEMVAFMARLVITHSEWCFYIGLVHGW